MSFPLRLVSHLLEQFYFTIFYFFVMAIPAAAINYFLLGTPEQGKTYSLFVIFASTSVPLLSFILAPFIYGKIMSRRRNFVSYSQLKFELIYVKNNKKIKPRHFIIRSYARFFLYPLVSLTFIPYILPLIISNGRRSIFDYLFGTEVRKISTKS